jgi:hypothetical protein
VEEIAGEPGVAGTVPPGSLPGVLEAMIIGAVKLRVGNSPRDSGDEAEDMEEETRSDCSKALEAVVLSMSVREEAGRISVMKVVMVAVIVWMLPAVFRLVWSVLS